MKKYKFNTHFTQILADTITPVSVYLKIRDKFPNSLLLEVVIITLVIIAFLISAAIRLRVLKSKTKLLLSYFLTELQKTLL